MCSHARESMTSVMSFKRSAHLNTISQFDANDKGRLRVHFISFYYREKMNERLEMKLWLDNWERASNWC